VRRNDIPYVEYPAEYLRIYAFRDRIYQPNDNLLIDYPVYMRIMCANIRRFQLAVQLQADGYAVILICLHISIFSSRECDRSAEYLRIYAFRDRVYQPNDNLLIDYHTYTCIMCANICIFQLAVQLQADGHAAILICLHISIFSSRKYDRSDAMYTAYTSIECTYSIWQS
jgi:hypothetical protein